MVKKLLPTIIALIIAVYNSNSQNIDSSSFRLNSRYNFYSNEKNGEAILHVPQNFIYNYLEIRLLINNADSVSWKGKPGSNLLRIQFPINNADGTCRIAADIYARGSRSVFKASSSVRILNHKPNEVRIDRLTGGLIVNNRQFIPFGFYCYSPVYPSLPEEEAVRGFNMMSPYQKILPVTYNQRKAYMDRCAQLGMKVNYNLLSVSGGGGVGSAINGSDRKQIRELLIKEINSFKDHPALLAWYIADEPNGTRLPPDSLLTIYKLVKETDPWHPVSVVFTAPFISALKYADALDIVMADPYPVPELPVTVVGNVAEQLAKAFAGRKPVWIVPQAFGGGEIWKREPTAQEIRSMTYQSIISGARGIQYFVRQGLNLFPKSAATWSECGKMAVEIAEMTPWLLSDEVTIPVSSGIQNIPVKSFLHNGTLLILAVNNSNYPVDVRYSLPTHFSGKVKVLFENRFMNINGGAFSDLVPAYGSQAYLFDIKPHRQDIQTWNHNLTVDPGFEDISNPGVPSSCYARNNGDRGTTFFLDSREHFEGSHSLRLVTPEDDKGARLKFFPINIRGGASYILSVMAKTDPDMDPHNTETGQNQCFEISLGDYGSCRFNMDSGWRQFVTVVAIPDTLDIKAKANIILQMPSAGTAWFDMLQAAECADMKECVNPELKIPLFDF
jgi:hypothetical protein